METDISGAEGIMSIQWGKNAKKIEEYDQMSLKEYIDPFTGEPVNKA